MDIDLSGFEFGVTIHVAMDWDRLCLAQRLALIIDGQEPHHVLSRVSDGAIDIWSAEVLFDGEGQMFLQKG
jgi:hypothetical protein